MQIDRRWFLSASGASLACFALPPALQAALPSALPDDSAEPLLFGVDYYPDQTPEHLWAEDARKIAATGFTVVRIAEFAWVLMEPSEGKFDFAWLHRSVDILHQAGIRVILGTPSAAPPPWLTEKYPEVLEVNAAGVRLSPGTRRFTCPTNPRYRELSLSIATAMAKEFAATPGIIGWQIDNELTLGESQRCFCPFCRTGFQQWLRTKYGSLDKLNELWGTVFWSQTYTAFQQIPVPLPSGAPPNPGLALDYDRYQSVANVDFLKVQLATLRQHCPRHFITTNNVAAVDVIVQRDLYAGLDFASTDNYPGFFAIIAAQGNTGVSFSGEQIAALTAWGLDMTRSAKAGKPFFVWSSKPAKPASPFSPPSPKRGSCACRPTKPSPTAPWASTSSAGTPPTSVRKSTGTACCGMTAPKAPASQRSPPPSRNSKPSGPPRCMPTTWPTPPCSSTTAPIGRSPSNPASQSSNTRTRSSPGTA